MKMIELINKTIEQVNTESINCLVNSKIELIPQVAHMKIIKRAHYTRGRKDGFMVGVNITTDDSISLKFNSTVFIGWSLCDQYDKFDKLFGTKTAVVRALKTAKLLASNTVLDKEEDVIVIGDAGFGGGVAYNCETYSNDRGILCSNSCIPYSLYYTKNNAYSLTTTIINNALRFVKGDVVLFDYFGDMLKVKSIVKNGGSL